MKKELGIVLQILRKRKGLTQPDVAEAIGVDKGTISRYEKGQIAPDFERMPVYASLFGVSIAEIFDMATNGVDAGPEIKGSVHLISWIQAGNWRDVIDNLHTNEGERIATTYKARKHTYALRVRGDSMEPKFPDGSIIIVEPEENPEPGSFVIIRQNGGEATFKQLMMDGDAKYLKPLNPRYPIMELRQDAVFCGVVKRVEMDV